MGGEVLLGGYKIELDQDNPDNPGWVSTRSIEKRTGEHNALIQLDPGVQMLRIDDTRQSGLVGSFQTWKLTGIEGLSDRRMKGGSGLER
jgi:hypothetical protein